MALPNVLDGIKAFGEAVSAPANIGLGIAGLVQARKRQEQQNYFNEENLALAKEAQAAQLAQQQLENEWYLNERDYQRSLQQTIFQREDTAMQRARDDFEAAGFSPLAAVGNMANAGQVVSSASSPGNMVSNNQASTTVSNFVGDALDTMASNIDSASGRALTQLMQAKSMAHDEDMAEFAHNKAYELKALEIEGALLNTFSNFFTQKKLQELIGQQNLDAIEKQGQNALNLQNDQQSWQDSQPKTRSPDQIVETFLNWLKKEDPLISNLVGDATGWEIGFKLAKEMIVRQFSGVFDSSDGAERTQNVREQAQEAGITLPEGWFN